MRILSFLRSSPEVTRTYHTNRQLLILTYGIVLHVNGVGILNDGELNTIALNYWWLTLFEKWFPKE